MSGTAFGGDVTRVTTTQELPLGFEVTVPNGDFGTQTWVYVLTDEALAIGEIAVVNTDYGSPYHAIQSNGGEEAVTVLGVAQQAIASGRYAFLLKRGRAPYIRGDGSVAAGEAIIPIAAGVADTFADGEEERVIGYALADDAADATLTGSVVVFAGMINCGI